jgi:hypothetical protein
MLTKKETEQKRKPKKSREEMAVSTMNLKKQGNSKVNNKKRKNIAYSKKSKTVSKK